METLQMEASAQGAAAAQPLPQSGATDRGGAPSITIDAGLLKPAQRAIGLATICVPPLGAALAVYRGFVQGGVSTLEIVLLVVMFTLTNFGLEFGFHRNLAHRAFKTTRTLQLAFAVLGSMAGTGRLLFWVANHRRHHQCSDTEDDPHSPHVRHTPHGAKQLGLVEGMFHAHIGHILSDRLSNCTLLARDINQDRALRWINEHYGTMVLLGLVIPTAIGGLATGSLNGALGGFLWGGLTRMFLVYQATWSLASFSHRWGSRPFDNGDQSANNVWVAIASFGSGWQNNHHAFPNSAWLGFRWYERLVDPTAWLIRSFEMVGLAWDVKEPTRQQIDARMRKKAARTQAARAA